MKIEPIVCSRCGAPLSGKNFKCEYCGTWHMDLSNMSKTISETIADLERENKMLMLSDMMERKNHVIIGNIGGISNERV